MNTLHRSVPLWWCCVALSIGAAAAQTPYVNPVKQALNEGKVVMGTTISLANTDVAAAMASVGFDFLWIEMEHSPITLESARDIILATRGLRAVPFTRVPFNNVWLAKRVLDIGTYGVMFPFSGSVELVKQAVAACKYPPEGVRGFSPGLAAARWGLSGRDYIRAANDNVLVIPIMEEKRAIDHIDEIAAIPGIDVLFIGANDLSYSLGLGGQLTHPTVEAAVDKVIAAGRKYGVPVGYPSGSPARIKEMIGRGIRFFQAGGDRGFMNAGARQLLRAVREDAGQSELFIPY